MVCIGYSPHRQLLILSRPSSTSAATANTCGRRLMQRSSLALNQARRMRSSHTGADATIRSRLQSWRRSRKTLEERTISEISEALEVFGRRIAGCHETTAFRSHAMKQLGIQDDMPTNSVAMSVSPYPSVPSLSVFYKCIGARLRILLHFLSLNSAPTTPFNLDPMGSPPLLMSTQALSSKLTTLPSFL